MTQIVILPHVELCPDGAVIEAEAGQSICEALLANDIELDHACEMSCACTTCHVIVREGFGRLNPPRIPRRTCSTRRGAWNPIHGSAVKPLLRRRRWSSKFPSTASTWRRRATANEMDRHQRYRHRTERYLSRQGSAKVNFVDLRSWVMALPGFDDDANRCGEKILEAIQQAWIDEVA